jgi:aryl-alcohol dehydrogenase-like predicted oxidoreductase
MEFRRLGGSGLQVSVAGLGCNNFGRRCDPAATASVVNKALDLGVNFFDTADVYGGGLSEEYLGKALGARRKDVVVATKFGMPMQGVAHAGGSRRYIYRAVEDSLTRLGSDYIDLYQIHRPDAETPIDETLHALDDLVRQGKVRYVGSSNFSGWQVADAEGTARAAGLDRFLSAQNLYNLLDRRIERELVPACKRFGISILPFFPLASGFLTGKYRRGEVPAEGTRLAAAGPMAERALTDRNFDTLERLEDFAAKRDRNVLELAMGWLASQSTIPSVIAGATRPDQVELNVRAVEWRLTPDELLELDTLTRR